MLDNILYIIDYLSVCVCLFVRLQTYIPNNPGTIKRSSNSVKFCNNLKTQPSEYVNVADT